MPISEKQLAANRANALRSTGPRTPRGKAISSRNAITHGIFAADLLASGAGDEHADEFHDLLSRLTTELAPQGVREELLVSQIAAQYWRLRRVFRTEAAAIENARTDAVDSWESQHNPDKHFRDLSRAEEIEFYGPGLADASRKRLAATPGGVDHSLAILRGARNEIERTGTLCEGGLHLVTLVLGDRHQLVCLAQTVLLPQDASASEPAPTMADLVAALDTCIAAMRTERDAVEQRHAETRTAILKRHSLPLPDAANKILRYEGAIQNALYRAMNELDRLQAARTNRHEPST